MRLVEKERYFAQLNRDLSAAVWWECSRGMYTFELSTSFNVF